MNNNPIGNIRFAFLQKTAKKKSIFFILDKERDYERFINPIGIQSDFFVLHSANRTLILQRQPEDGDKLNLGKTVEEGKAERARGFACNLKQKKICLIIY